MEAHPLGSWVSLISLHQMLEVLSAAPGWGEMECSPLPLTCTLAASLQQEFVLFIASWPSGRAPPLLPYPALWLIRHLLCTLQIPETSWPPCNSFWNSCSLGKICPTFSPAGKGSGQKALLLQVAPVPHYCSLSSAPPYYPVPPLLQEPSAWCHGLRSWGIFSYHSLQLADLGHQGLNFTIYYTLSCSLTPQKEWSNHSSVAIFSPLVFPGSRSFLAYWLSLSTLLKEKPLRCPNSLAKNLKETFIATSFDGE